MDVIVAKVGAPVGLKGYVRLEIRTDNIRERFAKGNILRPSNPKLAPLTVKGLRKQGAKIVAAFEELDNPETAAHYRGCELLVDSDETAEPDAYYPHQLRGLKVLDLDGQEIGTVTELIFSVGQEILEIKLHSGKVVLLPFVLELVPEVDLDAQSVTVDPPAGLFELEAGEE
ncbi:16S rRNA processing protein RimM [Boudabousia liubingyangii]|uniref:Ribosome maturation factor RimM n=1 Tax=Boudabousia liubingyangii TaxID=1921764 RepID=A0A1Q5PKN8_9ACTO|nr:ribosome maturation factor RimM [Boudabousia liubingyangii]OKL47203.1 16S rRNA processing protein RimM [Boudabousia liubingyangii]